MEKNHGRIKVSSALAAEMWAIRISKMLQTNSDHINWTIKAALEDIHSVSANLDFAFTYSKDSVVSH